MRITTVSPDGKEWREKLNSMWQREREQEKDECEQEACGNREREKERS